MWLWSCSGAALGLLSNVALGHGWQSFHGETVRMGRWSSSGGMAWGSILIDSREEV